MNGGGKLFWSENFITWYAETYFRPSYTILMKKALLSTACLLLIAVGAFAQVHRDTDGSTSSGIDPLSVGIGIVIGLVVGYLAGSRSKKA